MNIAKVAIIGSVVLVIVFIFLLYLGVVPGLKVGQDSSPVNLEVWGVFDDSDAFVPIIEAFQAQNINVSITYRKKTIEGYEDELVRAFAVGKGPDIFIMKNTWVPRFRDLLSPVTANIFPIEDFKTRFVDVAQKDFIYRNNIYGIPLYVDTLALYYNIDLFNSAGLIEPPKYWDEFERYSKLLTRRSSQGDVLVSGAAIGSGQNVLYSKDILSLIMMQKGVRLSDSSGKIIFDTEPASGLGLEFYTRFSKLGDSLYSWPQDSVNNSQDMFSLGRVAMMFGYSWTKNNILQKSPRLRFAVAYMPQIRDSVLKKNYADYWGYGVYVGSGNKELAWRFLKFLAQPNNTSFYLSITGGAASQKSILVSQQEKADLEIFANQALTADSWLQLNDAVIEDVMVETIDQNILSGQSVDTSLTKAATKINSKILSK